MIIVLSVLLTDAFTYAISQTFILSGYEKIEQSQMVQNLQQANDAFQNRLTQMSVKIKDWAIWDDSYLYVKDPETSNFAEETLGKNNIPQLLDLDIFMYADSSEKKVYAQAPDSTEDVGLNNPVANGILDEKRLLAPMNTATQEGAHGIVSLDSPMLVVSSPILPSSGEGTAAGTMIFGKFINDDLVTEMSALTHLSLKGFMYNASSLPEDVLAARTALSFEKNYFVHPLSTDSLAGYTSLYDLNNTPTYIVRVERPRGIYQQGQSTIRWFLIFTSTALLVCGMATVLSIEAFVITRLRRLSLAVSEIGSKPKPEVRIDTGGYRDDVGQLSAAINDMLTDLAHAREKETALNSSERDMGRKIKERFEEVNQLNKQMLSRELEMVELKEIIHTLQKRVEASGKTE